MNTTIGTLLLLICIAPVSSGQTTDLRQQFVTQINDKWKLEDYSSIMTLINTRLQGNTNDVLCLGLKAYFHIYAVNDLNLARVAIAAFNSEVQQSNHQGSKERALHMKNEIWAIPLSESGPLLPDQQKQFHVLFPLEFPMSRQVLSIEMAVHPVSP